MSSTISFKSSPRFSGSCQASSISPYASTWHNSWLRNWADRSGLPNHECSEWSASDRGHEDSSRMTLLLDGRMESDQLFLRSPRYYLRESWPSVRSQRRNTTEGISPWQLCHRGVGRRSSIVALDRRTYVPRRHTLNPLGSRARRVSNAYHI